MAGSGPVPWRQAPSLFNTSVTRPEVQPRASTPFEVDASTSTDRLVTSERRVASSSIDNKRRKEYSDRFMNGIIKLGAVESFENGSAGIDFLSDNCHS